MKLNLTKTLFILILGVSIFAGLVRGVQAQADFCSTFPVLCNVTPDPTGEGAQGFVFDRVSIIVSLMFTGIIVIGVITIVKAAVIYISSQGDEGAIVQSQKSIKNVFIGMAMLFIGIVGIVLVLAFFGGTGGLTSGKTVDDVLRPACQICEDQAGPNNAACARVCAN